MGVDFYGYIYGTSLEILKIHKSLNEHLFLESSYMRHFNTIYSYGLKIEWFNKVFSTLNGTTNVQIMYI